MGLLSSLFNRPYTIGELMNIDASRQDRAGRCIVELEKTYHELKKETILDKFRSFFNGNSLINIYYVIFKLKVTSDTGTKHTVFIKLNPDFNLQNWSNNRIKIYCDCSDFKYRSAYKLQQHNSLFLNDKLKIQLGSSITDSPKNKSKITLLCKHSFAAVNWLISNYRALMMTI